MHRTCPWRQPGPRGSCAQVAGAYTAGVGFRDEEEAKHSRLEALARELEDREKQLAEADSKLAEKQAKLASQARQLEEKRSEAEDIARAAAHLDMLRSRRPPEATTVEAAATSEGDKRALELASVSVFGHVDMLNLGLLAAFPTLLATFYLGVSRGAAFGWLPPLALAAGLAAVRWGGRAWARRRWSEEEAWARSRPYALHGYPALLGRPPSSGLRSMVLFLDGDDHTVLEVALRFSSDADAPVDLADLVVGFDPELAPGRAVPVGGAHRMDGDVRDDPEEPTFHRLSPVSYRTSKAGSRFVETGHNRAVRAWVRRFDRELLEPLHRGHGLARAELRLR